MLIVITDPLLNWLPNRFLKGINSSLRVNVENNEDQNYSGRYSHSEYLITVVYYDECDMLSTIAHEFCHYLQYERGDSDIQGTLLANRILREVTDYKKMIKMYFTMVPNEMEALLFQEKYARSDLGQLWLKKYVME